MYINSKCLDCVLPLDSHTTHTIHLILVTSQRGRVCPPPSTGALIPHAGCWSVWVPSSLPLGSGVPVHQQTPGDSEGQRSPACCSPWVRHNWATKWGRSHSRVPFHVDALHTPSALTLRWSTPVQWTPSPPPWALVSSAGCLSVWTLLALREFPPCPRLST